MYTILYFVAFVLALLELFYLLFSWHDVAPEFFFIFVFTIFALGGALWMSLSQNVTEATLALKISYLGSIWQPFFLYLIVSHLCSMELPHWSYIVLILLGLLILGLVFTMGYSTLYYRSMHLESVRGSTVLVREYGPLHSLHLMYLLLYVLLLTDAIRWGSRHRNRISFGYSKILLGLLILNLSMYMLKIVLRSKFDFVSYGFVISCGTLLYVSRRMHIYDADAILAMDSDSSSSFGIVLLDPQLRFMGASHGIRSVIPGMAELALESPVPQDASPECSLLVKWAGGFRNGDLDEICILDVGAKSYRCSIDTYFNRRHSARNFLGYVIYLQDETLMQNHVKTVRSYNESLVAKERELENLNISLKHSMEAAQQANVAKSQFLAKMSHELRTPINAVLGMNEMILRENKDASIAEYAENIKSAGNALLSQINDILDFSKIESGKLELISADYRISDILADVVLLLCDKATSKGLKFVLDVDKNIPDGLHGDEVRLRQVLVNILNNAVKYTEKGSVELSVSMQDTAIDDEVLLTFHVRDTGIGIRREDLPKIFSPFHRIEERRIRTVEGSGLGMSITKQLLEMMGSRLEVESVYGKGSDFYFSVRQKVWNREPVGNFDGQKHHREEVKPAAELFHAPDAHILVVDDTPMNLTVVRELLKRTMVQIDTAADGEQSLELLKKNAYNIVFMDHLMPGMDGVDTLHEIQLAAQDMNIDFPNRDTPVIILTANAIAGVREKFLSEGFADYLSKPVNPRLLEGMLLKYLPPELVHRVSGSEACVFEEEDVPAVSQSDEQILQQIARIEELDSEIGIANCGSRETFLKVLQEFSATGANRVAQIEHDLNEQDIRNYTVRVHALKSAARLIGAQDLSRQAAYLESCGNAVDIGEITASTPNLLQHLAELLDKIQKIFPDENPDDLPEISAERLEEAYTVIKELAAVGDFNSIDQVMKKLKGSRIPDAEAAVYNRLKEAVDAVDTEAVLAVLKERSETKQ